MTKVKGSMRRLRVEGTHANAALARRKLIHRRAASGAAGNPVNDRRLIGRTGRRRTQLRDV